MVALSTTEAEFMAGTEATKEAVWIMALLEQLCTKPVTCTLRGDNQGSLALAANPVYHQRMKHIDIRQKFISEMVNWGGVSVEYVPTKHMLADGFTKPLAKEVHWAHCLAFGLKLKGMITDSTGVGIGGCKRKFSCQECGNLFETEESLQKHRLRRET